jgi:hypothetical protein
MLALSPSSRNPSLSLARVANCDKVHDNHVSGMKQFCYFKIINHCKFLLASSTSQNVNSTASRMLNHFTQTPVYQIQVGGLGLSKDFLKNISDYLKRPVQTLNIAISGLSAEQIQDYLIPLSLQLKDPVEPVDETTVNLLPPSWAKRYKNQKAFKNYWSLSLFGSFVTWGTFLILLAVFIIFNQKLSILKSKISQGPTLEKSKSETTVNEVNSLSKRVISASENTISPESLINQIASKKPSNIRVQKYDLNMEDGNILVEGIADNRQTLLSFKESLQGIKEIQSVDLPITNLITEGPINFSLRLATKSAQKPTVPKLKL